MFKNCLAFIGLFFFVALAMLGVVLTLAFFNASGIYDSSQILDAIRSVNLSRIVPFISGTAPRTVLINGTPMPTPTEAGVEALIKDEVKIEHVDLVQSTTQPDLPLFPTSLPVPTNTPLPTWTNTPLPTPTFTPTPVPPLDPVVYRTEVLIRSKNFGVALDAFMSANDRLGQDNSLMNDPTWRGEVVTYLEGVRAAGLALAEVGPPPPEYAVIDALLYQVAVEAANLHNHYLQGIQTGDTGYFTTASGDFTLIKETMAQAVLEMAKAGWPME